MIMRAFAIYDMKGQLYNAPFFMNTPGQAIRAFSDLANDPATTIGRHPADYVLYELGTFDDATGHLEAAIPAMSHGVGVAHVKPRQPIASIPELPFAPAPNGSALLHRGSHHPSQE